MFARCLSAVKEERVAASALLKGPKAVFDGDRKKFIAAIHDALYCSKICAYAQGFQLMREAQKEYNWTLHFGEIAKIFRGGCIIRARFLNRIKDAYDTNPALANLMLDPYFTAEIESRQAGWRRVIAEAVRLGVPVPAFGSSLSYFDGYRRAILPANLIQAQRDLFGAHTYERTDKEGTFHSHWG